MGTAELLDREVLPDLLKAESSQLDVCEYDALLAWKKWGSPETLDAEWKHQTEEKNTRSWKRDSWTCAEGLDKVCGKDGKSTSTNKSLGLWETSVMVCVGKFAMNVDSPLT